MSSTTANPKTKKVKSARNSKKTKICKECKQDILANEKRDMYMKHDTYHQLRVKEYCKDHEFNYKGHKCKPIWCNKCRYLEKYEITIDTDVA
jgi:hypothetical protein